MNYDEVWGIEASRVREYFDQQNDVSCIGENEYIYRNAQINIEQLEDRHMGSLRFARTRLTISGGADSEEIHRRFYMRFLSAGG